HARLSPSRESFREKAHLGNLIPVYREIMADMETPVSAYHKIDTGDHSFLFESVEKGNKFARYSFLGASPHLIFQARGKNITLREGDEQRAYTLEEGDLLRELERLMAGYRPVPTGDLPLFYGGAVGYLGFEAATGFEPTVPRAKKDDAVAKIGELEARLARAVPGRLLPVFSDIQPLDPAINMTRGQYVKMTEAM